MLSTLLPTLSVFVTAALSAPVGPGTGIHLYGRNTTFDALPIRDGALRLFRREDIPNGCFEMKLEQLPSLTGFNALEDRRKHCWGDGELLKRHVNYNSDNKTWRCMAGPAPIEDLQAVGDPTCETSDDTVEGESSGSDTEIVFTYTTGSTTKAEHQVRNEAEFAIGHDFTAEAGFRGIASVKSTTSLKFDYKFADNKATTEEKKEEHSFKLTYKNKDKKACKMTFQTKSCKQNAKGNILSKADGQVMFEYVKPLKAEDITQDKSCYTDGKEHRVWGMTLRELKDEERIIKTPVESVVSHSLTAKYKVDCEGDAAGTWKDIDTTKNMDVVEGPESSG
ncbi:hypothetical protein DL96DRAFT_1625204 [Flagelloscypha sp. PMI_526]|nr:hypothetical protein DL96DRAFT_1625204 [Flagelloscypha sp. PMI_526]